MIYFLETLSLYLAIGLVFRRLLFLPLYCFTSTPPGSEEGMQWAGFAHGWKTVGEEPPEWRALHVIGWPIGAILSFSLLVYVTIAYACYATWKAMKALGRFVY